jgi:enamine deaminase RidA (YjgF/YER057c/UK114 family)
MKDRETMRCVQPAHWPRPKGYANAIVASGRTVFVSGMIGSNALGQVVAGDFVKQARQTLKNIVEVLSAAGAQPEHIVRMNWYVVDRHEYLAAYEALGVVYREIIGRHYPAMTAVQVTSLIEDAARLEIEVTAVIPDGQ